MKTPFLIQVKVFCEDKAEAQRVQAGVNELTSDLNLIGSELLNFYAVYRKNENVLKPIILDVAKRGVSVIGKYTFQLMRLKF